MERESDITLSGGNQRNKQSKRGIGEWVEV